MCDLAKRFKALANQWRIRTMSLSNMIAAAEDPAYQEIIAMGEAAVP
ncbi:hypothetical protein LCGC14_0734650 [marine sediment metagenome]|uniref:Uncharacterized protein n=1 Tax=marine sediment metagenome TaxID=412755 RepID=A0A0F9TFV1_9ZZZZ